MCFLFKNKQKKSSHQTHTPKRGNGNRSAKEAEPEAPILTEAAASASPVFLRLQWPRHCLSLSGILWAGHISGFGPQVADMGPLAVLFRAVWSLDLYVSPAIMEMLLSNTILIFYLPLKLIRIGFHY